MREPPHQTTTRCLVLVPTQFELNLISKLVPEFVAEFGGTIHVCGFGPVTSAARTSQLVFKYSPKRVLLLGIAGTFKSRLEKGRAYSFSKAGCFGVGVGFGTEYQSASEIGWNQFDSEDPKLVITDQLNLTPVGAPSDAGLIVTGTTASRSHSDALQRLKLFASASAEDMEAFGVATACRLANTSVTVIRGISNTVPEPDTSQWMINEALTSAVNLAREMISGFSHEENR